MLWGKNRGKWKGQQSNPGHLWQRHHCTTTARQPLAVTIPCMCYTGGTECLSQTPGSYTGYVPSELCQVLTVKFSPSGENPWWVVFLILNAQIILPHTENKKSRLRQRLRKVKPEGSWVWLPETATLFTSTWGKASLSIFQRSWVPAEWLEQVEVGEPPCTKWNVHGSFAWL